MHRPKSATRVRCAFAICALAGLVVGCAGGPEQATIRNYFTASRVNDTATLGNIAMVRFDRQEDGTVQSFSIESVNERGRALRMRELSQAVLDMTAAEDEFTERKKEYQDENFDAINRVLEAEREDGKVARGDVEVQEVWTTWRQETMGHAKAVSDAQAELSSETAVAELSMFDPTNPIDVTEYDGDLISKDVTITARVRAPDDQEEVDQPMVVTMEQVHLTGPDGQQLEGRWVITGLELN